MSKITLFAVATDSRVDAEAGILRGVRIITAGEAKGHTWDGIPMLIDGKSLDQVALAGQGFADGIPVMFDHWSGIEDLVGSIKDVRREGDAVYGDLQLLKTHEHFPTIIEMAETMPSNFGVSISFHNAPEPVITGTTVTAYAVRVVELYSADLVQQPAANPSLFMAQEPETPPVVEPPVVEPPVVEPETPPVVEPPAEPVVEPVVEPTPEGMARLTHVNAEFERVSGELTALQAQHATLQASFTALQAEHDKLSKFHKAALKAIGLAPAEFAPTVEPQTASPAERYFAAMAAGDMAEAATLFKAHKKEIFAYRKTISKA